MTPAQKLRYAAVLRMPWRWHGAIVYGPRFLGTELAPFILNGGKPVTEGTKYAVGSVADQTVLWLDADGDDTESHADAAIYPSLRAAEKAKRAHGGEFIEAIEDEAEFRTREFRAAEEAAKRERHREFFASAARRFTDQNRELMLELAKR